MTFGRHKGAKGDLDIEADMATSESYTLEEEEIVLDPDGPTSVPSSPTTGGPLRSDARGLDVRPRRVAFFALGALMLLVSIGVLAGAFTQPYYEVDVRDGPQPSGEDRTHRHTFTLHLDDYVYHFYRNGEGAPTRTDETWKDAPIVGIAMKQLAWTGYVGIGLLGVAFVAGILHRLGALTVPGPAPIFAVFGIVLLFAGLVPFIMDIAHHARIEWIPGRLDLHPMFFTMNADGDRVHDLYMGPLLGLWLHAGAAAGAVVGSVLMFWADLRRGAASVRRFMEASVPALD